jgi:SagB-type dehydrogenase family enzyme
MNNRDIQAAWEYHNRTKHSQQSIRSNPHYLDWENQPIPFKIYSRLEPIPLPRNLSSAGVPALAAICPSGANPSDRAPDLQTLATILYLSGGITKRKPYPGGEILFRAAACTGALYHIDLYVVSGDLSDLEAGVYHFSPHDFALRKLRSGDYRAVLVRASANEPSVARAPVILVSASTYWRNAWKYQARAYRHAYWDNGTILANLLGAAAAHRLPAKIVLGFVDALVNGLLGLDPSREGALSLLTLGSGSPAAQPALPEVEPIAYETIALSKTEVDYPAMRDMHEASSLETEEDVSEWHARALGETAAQIKPPEPEQGRIFPLQPMTDAEIPQDTLEQVIQRRGSTRNFSREPISFAQLSTMLKRSTCGIPADFLREGSSLNDLYLIVNTVHGLPSGAYYFRRDESALELLKEGDFRREGGYLGLGQDIPADASVDIFLLTDLEAVLNRMGNRGYRAAQLEAAIMGGKLYLSAYTLGLGASGLTFFDDDVTEFFSPHAAGKSVMFLIALGKSARKRAPQ